MSYNLEQKLANESRTIYLINVLGSQLQIPKEKSFYFVSN